MRKSLGPRASISPIGRASSKESTRILVEWWEARPRLSNGPEPYVKVQVPNDYGVLASARQLDDILKLGGTFANRFMRLSQAAERLSSAAPSDECVGPAHAVMSDWPSVMRLLQRIERDQVEESRR
jgi:hypothetical protein